MKKTITIQVGNSDNKLSQAQWADFCNIIQSEIVISGGIIHFSAPSVGWANWQNAAWVFEIENDPRLSLLKQSISVIGKANQQDSVAWTEGITEFV